VGEKYHNSSPHRAERNTALRPRLQRAHWNLLPLIVAVCGWCTTLFLCRVMLSRQTAQVAQTAALATRNIQSKITSSISTQVAPLEALVARWGADQDPWQPEWEAEAKQLHQMYPALEAIDLVDASYRHRWGVPSMPSRLPSLRPAIDAARRSRQTMVVPTTGSAGDKSFVVLIPMFRRGQFDGCVVAPLRTEQWLNSIVDSEVPKGYSASISHREERVYTRAAAGASHALVYLSEGRINLYGMPWVVRVWPTLDTWTELRQTLLALSLLIGLLIYMSGALAVAARRKTRAMERAKLRMAGHQENLRHANQRMGAVIQASPLAIVAMDLSSQVKSWNSAAERIFGWSADEVMNRVPPFVDGEQREEFRTKVELAGRGELIAGLERQWKRKDGSPIDVAVWTAPLRDAGRPTSSIIMTIADISERKKLEEQLRHSQKMEAVGRLAGGVAHDFNNLLTVINGYGHMMLDTLNSGDRMHGHAEQIVKAGNQAAALTTQLLAFSRRQMIQPKAVDLNHLITNLEKMLRRVIGEDIALHTLLSPELASIKADPNQMEQVLINLVANARDAMPRGGALTVATKNVTLDECLPCEGGDIPPGSYVEMAVADTGEGMDAETRNHLFEPFFTTKERGKGTGLGLSSVYGSVRQNGGGIVVWSERGSGAAFRIYLPQLREPEPAQNPEPAPSCIRRGTETILLVEDEVPLRRMLRESLSGAGYHVLEAGDGADALRKWEPQAAYIDLLLTDVVMPLVNGRELAKRLAAVAPAMQVIYMSGYDDNVIAYHGILEDGTTVVQKPFSPAALLLKLREVLDAGKGQPSVSPAPVYYRAGN
jgi:PAS domain S-box-containing protein